MRPVKLLVLAVLLIQAAAATPAERQALEAGFRAVVTEVVDGDTVLLDNGEQVRLVGLQAPKLPLGRPGFPTWPLAPEAKAALEALVLGRSVTLSFGGRSMDRHGRHLAHLHDDRGRWIQGEMLARGLARVYSFADNRALVPEMLALEAEARAQRAGIWSHPFYRVRAPEEAGEALDTFQIVEGHVVAANVAGGRGFLNFSEDWRRGFTVVIHPRDRRLFTAEGIDIRDYEGHLVRVRGWITRFDGPQIEADHPEQIEILQE